ncbi:hypothetical protein Hanom_Chr06g00578811 [Helianthus anomalus]
MHNSHHRPHIRFLHAHPRRHHPPPRHRLSLLAVVAAAASGTSPENLGPAAQSPKTKINQLN